MLKLGERCLVRDADQLIVVSHELQSYFLKQYGRATAHIPNGVEEPTPAECGRTSILSEYGLQPQDYVLYLGRLVPEKRIQDLVVAYRNVPGTRRLVITGSGAFTDEYVKALKCMAAEDLRVVFTGVQNRTAVHTLLHNAALYVLPSELEGLPMSLLECIQHGTPAVVSDIAPHRELLGGVPQYDLFFPAKNNKALADRITRALSSPEYYRVVASHARERIVYTHSWPVIAKRTEEVFYASVGRTSPRTARVSVPVSSQYGVGH